MRHHGKMPFVASTELGLNQETRIIIVERYIMWGKLTEGKQWTLDFQQYKVSWNKENVYKYVNYFDQVEVVV